LYTVSIFITLSFMINVYGHLGFEIVPARFRNSIWFKILNTTVYHNMHHSHVQGNYSLYFRHWDRWMKTENKNYEPYFDKVLERRKSNTSQIEPSTESKNNEALSSVKKILAVVILLLNVPFTEAQIEGKWKMEDRDVIVEIYQHQNKYYCKVMDAGNFVENNLLKTQEVFLFSALQKSSATKFCCGTVYHPYKNIRTEGCAEILPNGKLKIAATKQFENEVVVFTRAES